MDAQNRELDAVEPVVPSGAGSTLSAALGGETAGSTSGADAPRGDGTMDVLAAAAAAASAAAAEMGATGSLHDGETAGSASQAASLESGADGEALGGAESGAGGAVQKSSEPLETPVEAHGAQEVGDGSAPSTSAVSGNSEAASSADGEAQCGASDAHAASAGGVGERAVAAGAVHDAAVGALSEEDAETVEEQEVDDVDESERESYEGLSLEELTARLGSEVENGYSASVRGRVESLRGVFFRKLGQYKSDRARELQASDGGAEAEEPIVHPVEAEFRALYDRYRTQRREALAALELERQENLKRKRAILEKIRELTTREEVQGATYREFEALRREWSEIKSVPAEAAADLYESYNLHVQQFYDYIRINRELRDLDYRRNLETKVHLCEMAEDLVAEEDIRVAFKRLQDLHSRWKEVGPVPREKSEEIWERFSNASRIVNERHREYNDARQAEYEENYGKKQALVEEVDTILGRARDRYKDWIQDGNRIIEIQKLWKDIGPVPRRHSQSLWERFRSSCDSFFTARREFDQENAAEEKVRVQQMEDLCVQVEALKDLDDWNSVSSEIQSLQKQWKSIGSVNRRKGQELWQRFNGACNHFFTRRNEARDSRRAEQTENLKKKRALLEELQSYQFVEDAKENIEWLKEIQNRWNAVGYVPFKYKEEIQQAYREALDGHYGRLRQERHGESISSFKERLRETTDSGENTREVQNEQRSLRRRIKGLQEERLQLETNLSFFSTSGSGTSPLLQQYQERLDRLSGEIEDLQKKLTVVENMERDASSGKESSAS